MNDAGLHVLARTTFTLPHCDRHCNWCPSRHLLLQLSRYYSLQLFGHSSWFMLVLANNGGPIFLYTTWLLKPGGLHFILQQRKHIGLLLWQGCLFSFGYWGGYWGASLYGFFFLVMRGITLWFHIVAQHRKRIGFSCCLETSESIHFVAQRRKRIGFLVCLDTSGSMGDGWLLYSCGRNRRLGLSRYLTWY